MYDSKELLKDLREKYEKTEKLVTEDSKLDPPNEPYKSHYAAKAILLELTENIKRHIEALKNNDTPDDGEIQRFKFILGHISVDLGRVLHFTEETSLAEKYLNESTDLLSQYESHPSAICAYLSVSNENGILSMNRGETEKSKEFLVKAENAYNLFKETKLVPLTIHGLFNYGDADRMNEEGAKLLEKLNTLTLFYLAQVFGSLGNLEKSAVYCHTTLKKQLLQNDFEPVDWALNAATLSQFFCTNNRFTEARHHLAAATQILLEYEKDMLKPGMSDDEKKSIEDNFHHRLADVNRCWVKYGLNLMSDSRDRLLRDVEETGLQNLKVSSVHMLLFGCQIDSAYENVITDRYLLDMDDARPVFLMTQKWIEKAKSYYTSDNEASEYSKIIQDHALAFKHLAFFESDPSNQAKMHKRRIDLLDDLLNMLNKVFYMNVVREVLYELGTAYSNILDIKLEAFEQSQKESNAPVNPQMMKKINDLITKSRNTFIEFISTYYQPKTETLKSDLAIDELIPIAFAHFQVARISYKFITPDKQRQLENLSVCLDHYRKFVAFGDKHKEVAEKMIDEVSVSREMITLLPLKLQRLRDNIEATIPAIGST